MGFGPYGETERIQEVEAGTITYGAPGERPHVLESNRPSSNFAAFEVTIKRAMAAALGIPYESLSKDFSQTNYSSMRAALNESWKLYGFYRKWFARLYTQPIWEMVIEEAYCRNYLGLADAINGVGASYGFFQGRQYWTPSNKRFLVEGHVYDGEELALTQDQANYLNSQGIVTALNRIGGLVAWGNRTACYPGITDVKDSSIPIRRMFAWIANNLILINWQFVDIPASRRRIETVRDQVNVWLNGLTAREYILGGRCEFEAADNPTLDMMDGIYRWHIYVTPPQAAEQLVFDLEYDPAYLDTLVS